MTRGQRRMHALAWLVLLPLLALVLVLAIGRRQTTRATFLTDTAAEPVAGRVATP